VDKDGMFLQEQQN